MTCKTEEGWKEAKENVFGAVLEQITRHALEEVCIDCSLRMFGEAIGEIVKASTGHIPGPEQEKMIRCLKSLLDGYAEATGGEIYTGEIEKVDEGGPCGQVH